jgi:energy-coupling factor transporter ATP-binding protein EcfA2
MWPKRAQHGLGCALERLVFLRFSVENFRSFRDRTELSFIGTRLADAPSWRIPAPAAPHGVLPVLGVFGANASGKSNLVLAFRTMIEHVQSSFFRKPAAAIPWAPFRMRRADGAPPTSYDVDFVVGGVRHHYGFRHTGAAYAEEWLYRWPGRTRQVLFHRNADASEPWYFGAELKGGKRGIAVATRPNALFLSTAAQMNHDLLGDVAASLTDGCEAESAIELRGHPVFPVHAPILLAENQELVRRVLVAADLGVAGVHPRQKNPAEMPPELFAEIKAALTEEEPPFELWLSRRDASGATWELPPDLESRGTQVVLSRVNDLLPALSSGQLLIVDEIDTSLHPDLCAAIVNLFTDPRTNPNGAQLLFSTHERDLLNHLRRDEVVLVDKGRDGASRLSVASDFDVRGRQELRRVHVEGRLGGVPVLGDLRAVWATRATDDA